MLKVSKDIYIIEAPTNVGIVIVEDKIFVIDPGTSKSAYREIKERFSNMEVIILNTHHHADHILLNYLYQRDFHSPVYANNLEIQLINNPELEGYYLFGSETPKILKKTFFKARKSNAEEFPKNLPIKIIDLPGHTPGHTGFEYNGVIFTGDLYFDKEILEKYGYPYHFSVSKLKETIKNFKKLQYSLIIPAHGKPTNDPMKDIDFMMKRIDAFENKLMEILKEPRSIEEASFILAEKFSIEFPSGFFYLFRSFVSSLIQDMERDLIEEGGKWKRI